MCSSCESWQSQKGRERCRAHQRLKMRPRNERDPLEQNHANSDLGRGERVIPYGVSLICFLVVFLLTVFDAWHDCPGGGYTMRNYWFQDSNGGALIFLIWAVAGSLLSAYYWIMT